MQTEVVTTSWLSRIIGSLSGVLIGIVLIIAAFIGVFWNEGRGLHTAQSLHQTAAALVSVSPAPIDPRNNQKPIYLTGIATTNDKLSDGIFGVTVQAIRLERKVLMYQWQEKEQKQTEQQLGGSERETKTYSYEPLWSESLINSNKFKEAANHENPAAKPIEPLYLFATTVTLGDFILSPELVSDIHGESAVPVPTYNPAELQARFNKSVRHANDYFYIGTSEQVPTIGDLKVYIDEVKPQTISVIAAQSGTELQPYLAPAGEKISLIVMGQVAPSVMIHDAEAHNQILTWELRLLALLMMVIGIVLLLRPVVVLADVEPFFGSIVGFGTGLIALIGGLLLWGCATAIAWFAIRPLWSIGLSLIIVLICCSIVFLKKKKAQP